MGLPLGRGFNKRSDKQKKEKEKRKKREIQNQVFRAHSSDDILSNILSISLNFWEMS